MRNGLINGAILVVSLVVSLLIAELLLRTLTRFPIHSPMANLTFDDRLLYRVDPALDGFDALGFRNPETLHQRFPKVAAIGDSHTLGYNVRGPASWPGVLQRMIGEPVYNFGVGSYGILQYVESTRLALEMGARKIIVGFFPLNDLAICEPARLKYWLEHFFLDQDFREQLRKNCNLSDDQLGNSSAKILKRRHKSLHRWLLSNSALFSMARHVKDLVLTRRDVFTTTFLDEAGAVNKSTESCSNKEEDFIYSNGKYKDFLARFYGGGFAASFQRSMNSDFYKSVIRKSIMRIKALSRQHGAKVYFLTIPSEARVKARYLSSVGWTQPIPSWVTKLADAEDAFFKRFLDTVRSMGLPASDATDHVVEAYGRVFESGRLFYGCDAHPFEEGYRAYADAALKLVRQR